MSSFVTVKIKFEADILINKYDWDLNVLSHQIHTGLDSKLKSIPINTWLVGMTGTTLTSGGKSWKS